MAALYACVTQGQATEGSKKMARAIRGRNLGATVALLAALLLLAVALVFVMQLAVTTSDGTDTPAVSRDDQGGSRLVGDPNIDHHAVVDSRYRNDIPATSQGSAGGSNLTRDPAIEHHAEVVQRLGGGGLR
jgi:hypothetical protein